jgi:hypothetical protein
LEWVAKTKKRVSFATPIAQVFGESSNEAYFLSFKPHHELCHTGYDPMIEECLLHFVSAGPTCLTPAGQSKEDYIRKMLSTPGWEPIASPVADDDLEEGEWREPAEVENTGHHTKLNTSIATPLQVSAHSAALPADDPTSVTTEYSVEHVVAQISTEIPSESPTILLPTHPPSQLISAEHFKDLEINSASLTFLHEDTTTTLHETHSEQVHLISVEHINDLEINSASHTHLHEDTTTTRQETHSEQVDDLAMFVDFVSSTPNAPLLHTPPRINDTDISEPPSNPGQPSTLRKSSRLAENAKVNPITGSIKLAQRVLMNKLGELSPDLVSKANGDFEQLAQHLPRPFTKTTMEALKTAIEQGNKPTTKKAKVVPAPAGMQA